jgi:hypothetical protein
MRNVLSTSTKLLAATAGIAAMLAVSTPAQAAGHNSIVWQFQHFFDCKILLITNPKLHAKLCLPGHINFDFLPTTTHFTEGDHCDWEWKKPE